MVSISLTCYAQGVASKYKKNTHRKNSAKKVLIMTENFYCLPWEDLKRQIISIFKHPFSFCPIFNIIKGNTYFLDRLQVLKHHQMRISINCIHSTSAWIPLHSHINLFIYATRFPVNERIMILSLESCTFIKYIFLNLLILYFSIQQYRRNLFDI